MMNKILLPILLLCGLVCAEYVEPVQIKMERSSNPVYYALPGKINFKMDSSYTAYVPASGKFLKIPLDYKVLYGGEEYSYLTVTADNRIFLGALPDNYDLPDMGSGIRPYVVPTERLLLPAKDSVKIPIRWESFAERGDKYMALQVGPFHVEGEDDPLSYQVLFYADGEIQVQFWNQNRKSAYLQEPMSNFSLVEKIYMDSSYVFDGVKVVGTSRNKIFSTSHVAVFENGKLRPGWIAKSFDRQGVKFNVADNGLDVDFGTQKAAGGLLAYDYSREHPVVGSFNLLSVDLYSLSYGDGLTETHAVPVYFWYFNEVIPKSYWANYPFYRNDPLFEFENPYLDRYFSGSSHGFHLNSCLESTTTGSSKIWPCAYYEPSWDSLLFNKQDPDTIVAPAIKMQTQDTARNRRIHIKSIYLSPRQPMSVQFLPPRTYKLSYDGGGIGFLTVGSKKAPIHFLEGSSVDAEIHGTPGMEISQIFVNGVLVFTDGVQTGEGFSIKYDEENNVASFIMNSMVCDMAITVKFTKCETRTLAAVTPSYEKSELFLDPSDSSRVVETYSVKDGFGRVVQTQVPLNTNLYKVTALYLDDAGNAKYAPKPYVSNKSAYAYEDMSCELCLVKSKAYYNGDTASSKERVDSYGYPYTEEKHHYGENNALVDEIAGMGEASFALSDKWAKTWRIPLRTANSGEFFTLGQMTDDEFQYAYEERLKTITEDDLDTALEGDYPYVLTIHLSYDSIFTQSIADVAGNVIASWGSHNGETLVTRNVYNDATSQLSSSYVEGHPGFETTYEYDVAGRLVATTSPDRGRSETAYDSKDRIRFTRDAKQIGKGNGYFTVLVYDDRDRVIRTGEVRGSPSGCTFSTPDAVVPDSELHLLSETVYGMPTVAGLLARDASLDRSMLGNILASMNGILPGDVGAVISYDGNGNVNTLKFSSYDRLGRKERQWLVYRVEEGAPAIEIAYSYNASNELSRSIVSEWDSTASEWVAVTERNRTYDRFGRLEKVDEGGDPLAVYSRNPVGTVVRSSYYDKGSPVYSKSGAGDIYGRTTRLDYADGNGKNLYSEELLYGGPLLDRLSGVVHTWGQGSISSETYAYDDLGRLASYSSDMSSVGKGSYAYDILGRLTAKTEKDTTLAYAYADGSYQPSSVSVNGTPVDRALGYDAAGRVWMDNHKHATYKLNALALPERVALYGGSVPASIGMDAVDSGAVADEEFENIRMAYDEGGTRVWERKASRGGYIGSDVTVPGMGVYNKSLLHGFELSRLDLVNGGYRNGKDGAAFFPVTDAQGNVRGYADVSGLRSAYAYQPFGTVEELREDGTLDERRWQGKEYDGEHGKYYFGARYFDPFFGMWMSPDPAGQYANPYTYGGDPVNYVDPTGLWSMGLGIVIGWDKSHGWSVGVGAAADVGGSKGSSYNTSYTWNQDGSNSFSLGASGSVQLAYFPIAMNFGGGYSYNSYSGHTLSTQTGACFGYQDAVCSGNEVGGSLYWDNHGNFMGATAFAENYVSVGGGVARVSNGYEWGFMGMEGRGLYAGVNAGGLYAEVSHMEDIEGGNKVNYGLEGNLNVITYDADNHPSGFKKETLEEAYEQQLKCGESCEVLFKKDGTIEIVERNGEGNHFETSFFGENEDDAHTHPAESSDPNASLYGPSNWDGSSVWERDKLGLNKNYVLLARTMQLVQYGAITKPEFMLSKKDRAPILMTWSIHDNVGWKWDLSWQSHR